MVWFTVPEVAKMLKMDERPIRRAIVRGDLPAHRPSARKTRLRWDQVCDWAETRRAA